MWSQLIEHHPTRVFALVLCVGVVLGGSLPELGNLVAYWTQAFTFHYFNKYFLLLGLLGVLGCGFALCRR